MKIAAVTSQAVCQTRLFRCVFDWQTQKVLFSLAESGLLLSAMEHKYLSTVPPTAGHFSLIKPQPVLSHEL